MMPSRRLLISPFRRCDVEAIFACHYAMPLRFATPADATFFIAIITDYDACFILFSLSLIAT